MIQKLLATTALGVVISTAAMADNHSASTNVGAAPVFSVDADAVQANELGYFEASKGQVLASNLIGKNVYNSTAEDAEMVGEVNDVIIGPNGSAEAIVIGVGGFLGIGEKDVAVDFDKISWVTKDGDRWLILETAKADLEAAPTFDRNVLAVEGEEMMSDDSMTADGMNTDSMSADGMSADNMNADSMNADEMSADGMNADSMNADEMSADGMNADGMSSNDMEGTAMVSQRDGWTAVEAGTMSAENILGTRVYGLDDKDLGEIGDVILTADGAVDAYVVDVGGFLGIGEKPVAIDATKLQVVRNENDDLRIFTNFTKDQLENHVAYDADAYKADRSRVVLY